MAGCSTVLNNLPGVYSLDIQQGNIVNQEMVDQLRPNMTKRQVLYIMGSPMLIDVFHQKRWDYLYSEQPGGGARVQKRLSLFFDDDKLIGVQGDFRPSSLPVVAESKETTVEIPKRNLDKTMWQKISGLFSDEPDLQASKRKTGADEPRRDDGNEKVFDEPF
ncbi:outer membrane protein assembly factor BamE [Methylomarinum vadi]|uniref:outer membrane protein assembly factor BamE n=1 Tax=Methylomarinum vadi TaxID=438855 RepID=UPI001F1D09E9|nr:outer membrane protein assembly factor BamE [Methylomarinum vadi]